MGRRFLKQFFIAFIVLLVVFTIGSLFYLNKIKPEPSCSDGILNQGEEEIDCGGPCISCELTKIKDLEVLWTKFFPSQNGFYDLAAQIRNPNQNYGSGSVPYKFTLYGSANRIVGEYSGVTFILPNQTKYLLKIKVQSPETVKQIDLNLGEVTWEKKPFEYQSLQLVIQKKEYHLLGEGGSVHSQARALLINKTQFDFEKIDIDVLLFDSDHNLISINTTEVRVLSSGEERDFVVTWYKEPEGQVSSMEVEAETNVFDPTNYVLNSTSQPEPFQEY